MAATWGEGMFQLRIDSSRLRKDAEGGLKSVDTTGVGRSAGQAYGQAFHRDAMGRLRDMHNRFAAESKATGTRAGTETGNEFGRSATRSAGSAGRSAGAAFAGAMAPSFRQVAGLATKIFATLGGITLFRSLFEGAREYDRQMALTGAVIKSTGGAAHVTAAHVQNLAGSMMQQAGVGRTVVTTGENMLLTFTRVRNEVGKGNDIFDQASQSILDMTAAMNGGQVSEEAIRKTAIQVGKALQDPIKGAGALRRVGVALTEQQQEQIKAFVASGNIMAAQKMILAELKTEFGGAAAAMADPIQRFLLTIRTAGTSVMRFLLEPLNQFISMVQTRLGPAVAGFTGKARPVAATAARLLFQGAPAAPAPAAGPGGRAAAPAAPPLPGWQQFLVTVHNVGAGLAAAFSPVIRGFIGQVASTAAQVWTAFTNLWAVLAPVAATIGKIAVAAVIGGFRALGAVLGVLGGALAAVAGFIRDNATWFQALAVGVLVFAGVMKAVTLATTLYTAAVRIARIAVLAFTIGMNLLKVAFLTNPIGLIIAALVALGAAIYYAWTHSATFRNVLIGVWQAIVGAALWAWNTVLKPIFGGLQAAWNAIVGAWRAAVGWIAGVFATIRDAVVGPFVTWWAANGEAIKRIWNAIWTNLRIVFAAVWGTVVAAISYGWAVVQAVFRVAWAVISGIWNVLWGTLSAYVTMVWNIIVAVVRTGWNLLVVIFVTVWNVLVAIWTGLWNVIVAVARVVWAAITTVIKIAWDVIVGIFTFFINLVTLRWGAAWNAISGMFVAVWNAIRGFVTTVLNSIYTVISSVWNAVFGVFRAVWNGIWGFFAGWWNGLRSMVSGAVNGIAGVLSGAWNGIKGAAIGVWNAITGGIKTAWDKIKDIIMAPVRWVASNVWNKFAGIVNTFTNFLGLGKPIPVLNLATGGIVPGRARGDRWPALLESEETVVSREHSRILAPAFRAVGVPGYSGGGVAGGRLSAGAARAALAAGVPGLQFGWLVSGAKWVGGAVVSGLRHLVAGALKLTARPLIDALTGVLTHIPGAGSGWGHAIATFPKQMFDKFLDWLDKKDKVAPPAPGAPASSAQVNAWLVEALAVARYPQSWLPWLSYLVGRESGGNPRAWNPTAVGVEHASGLMQTIGSTFAAYALPGYGDIWNPVHNAIAGIRYIGARYGAPWNIPNLYGGNYVGYRRGGRPRGRPVSMAGGGWLREPVTGVGLRTGRRYSLAEYEDEAVTPASALGGTVHFHFHGPVTSREQAKDLVLSAYRALQRERRLP